MMIHVWGGGSPPELYAAWTAVKGLGLDWPTVLGYKPSLPEIELLVECVNVVNMHNNLVSNAR